MNKKRFLAIALMVLFIPSFPGFGVAADNEVLLSRAEAAFRQGNELLQTDPESAKDAYLSSVNYYNSIIESGISNAGLYYNLANAYIRLDETGNAILNYRKALLYSPNDTRIKYNLDYARSLQKNGFSPSTENEVLRILFFWHYMLPRMWKLVILVAANFVLWSALVLRLFGVNTGRVAVIAVIVVSAFGISFASGLYNSRIIHGVVTAESAIGRLGDSLSYEPAFDAPLYSGVEFTVKQRRVGWILAGLPNDELVWLEEADCGLIEEDL